MLEAVDGPVQGFTLTFYPPSIWYTAFFCVAIGIAAVAAWWLTSNVLLFWDGVRIEGRVIAGTETRRSVSDPSSSMNVSVNQRTHHVTIEYTAEDGVKRTLRATAVSYGMDDAGVNVGVKVPVRYSRRNPVNAVYDKPLYALGAPALALVLAIALLMPALWLCYEDIRVQNSLAISSQWPEGKIDAYQSVIIDCDSAIRENPKDAAAFERRGDAQFAIVQFRDAIEDYSKALALRPERADALHRKRAKAEWLEGRDTDALFDWLRSAH